MGTTNSAVAVQMPDGSFKIVPPKGARSGMATMPSVVAYNAAGQVIVGADAMRVKPDGVRQVVFRSVKRLLGRTYAEAHQAGVNPSALGADPRGRGPELVRLLLPGGRTIQPEAVVAQLIRALVAHAEAFLGCRVTRAVLGTPVQFTKSQTMALERAAELSGIQYVTTAPEPELAVRAYGYKLNPSKYLPRAVGARAAGGREAQSGGGNGGSSDLVQGYDSYADMSAEDLDDAALNTGEMRHVMVADVGGGTFDVCMVRHIVDWDEIHILYTSGDEGLGGDDYDTDLAKWAEKELAPHLKREKVNLWPLSPANRKKLRIEVRKAKERLSSTESTAIPFAGANLQITRHIFNTITLETTRRFLSPIRTCAFGADVRLPGETVAEAVYDKAVKRKRRWKANKKDKGEKRTDQKVKSFAQDYANDVKEEESRVDTVLCIGAASWTPAVRDLLRIVTGCTPDLALVDPETSCALGAAILAAITDSKIDDMHVHSAWRNTWATHVMKQPRLLERLKKEKEEFLRKEEEEALKRSEGPGEALPPTSASAGPAAGTKLPKLHAAALRGDVTVVDVLLERSPNPGELLGATAGGGIPLHFAAMGGSASAVRALLPRGVQADAMLSAVDAGGFAPLHFAAQEGHTAVVQALLELSSDRSALLCQRTQTDSASTPLELAVANNRSDAAGALLELAPRPQSLLQEESAEERYTPLQCAALLGHLDVVKALLSHASGVQEVLARPTSEGGFTALHMACQQGHPEVVCALLDQAPDAEALLNARDDEGNAPMHLAAQCGSTGAIHAQLLRARDREAMAGIRCTLDGWTPLHNAAACGQNGAVRALLMSVPRDRPLALALARAGDGSTPLHVAAEEGHVPAALSLLQYAKDEQQAQLFAEDAAGRTPLQRASAAVAQGRDPQLLQMLRELADRGRPVGAGSRGDAVDADRVKSAAAAAR